MLFFAFQQVKHAFYQIVNVKNFQLCTSIIYRKSFIVGYGPAECRNRTVILWSGVAHQIHKTIHIYRCTSLFSIGEK